ncbi:cysteine and glycine-rich protein 2 [Thecamonas trahens ATCC 50062]|uniref:Cysteine and glycine-rich protein 2 n=1 Tax=Thecamonas trahens ATCC 50062 TaxID=461836 RepID=A0A0L0DC96_THETB|nr:cysteine and glycine-rich protein 2 [Thecamonas trahens ATCC 50062]KNC49706.1 cysteine and glycine-rich protein 2 [Thecamonas trahens ATCC 50062]|eukprot:XP_013757499.1 cysteine and glycine-rich protein 2 [Thecamonas trahens ATCC 50062]
MPFGGSPKCPVCSKSVYHAEKAMAAGKAYHKACLKCTECNKRLDSTSINDRDGQIYCKTCYGRNFGAVGYGYGQGAGTAKFGGTVAGGAKVTKVNKFGGSPKCPRCDKSVYPAEKQLGPGGSSYHKACFKCTECSKRVDSVTMAVQNDVLYCKTCHGSKFGPKGFGYSTSQVL